jgi:enoyl-CoA hydratase/carnithine racemase
MKAPKKTNGMRHKMKKSPATKTQEIRLSRRSPAYWRVTFDHPPLNVFGPEGILEMAEIMTALETDERVKVVVFDSAVEGFFLNHSDFLGKLEDLTGLPAARPACKLGRISSCA